MIVKLLKKETGSVLILVALAMTALCGFAALTVDYGNLYMNRTDVAKVADAAALAGAKELPRQPALARSVATTYAAANGLTGDIINPQTPDDYTLTVTVSRNVPMLFAKVLGINNKTVSAKAKVAVGYAASVPEIVPFAVGVDQINKISKTDMWTHQFTMRLPPSGNIANYGQYEFDYCNVFITGASSSDYMQWLQYGYKQSFTIGQNMTYYAPSTGSQGAVDAFADRIDRDPNSNYLLAKVPESRVMLVPVVYSIYYKTDSNGNYVLSNNKKVALHQGDSMKIIGFIGFFLETVAGDGHGGNASGAAWRGTGRFLKDLNVGTGVVTPNEYYYYGALASQLVE